jgi:Raf kinase inhibitor-like YbhB/YbcL family protein
MTFTVKTTSFNNEESIPQKYTCEGENISPSLEWEDVPNSTQSFVLLIDDPDAILGTWNHWLIYNIPNHITKLEENIQTLPSPAKLGKNSWGSENYSGPCPPIGEHRYYFKLFALNAQIQSKDKVSRTNIEQLMKPYIIGETLLMGRYERAKKK